MQPVIKKIRFALLLDEGISQRDLCDRFGISPANFGAMAKRKNLNTVAFFEQETGWMYVGKLWYPPQ
ncbi:helix-turn-helix domain-containing protein [Microcoleus sp. MON2_D5]|uniref:helix-turn-helix domain-containing protein n=1 Tax=Microcoleus sp. MON2_D5 TaxID=2818833 RepID=UPI002FCF0B4B